mmetsp:Transcript_23777/g.51686  ORF Transcript_23777/g.51686 Transcript_23777/m.51686 type:complete len:204 (-) Transcript_23777:1338-1949(-)
MKSMCPPHPVEMVGMPDAMASIKGRPQPSPWVGKMKPSTALNNFGISLLFRKSWKSSSRPSKEPSESRFSRSRSGTSCLGSSGDQPKIWVLTRRRTDTLRDSPFGPRTDVYCSGKASRKLSSRPYQFFRGSHLNMDRKVKDCLGLCAKKLSNAWAPERKGGCTLAERQLKAEVSTASGRTFTLSLLSPDSRKASLLWAEGTQT